MEIVMKSNFDSRSGFAKEENEFSAGKKRLFDMGYYFSSWATFVAPFFGGVIQNLELLQFSSILFDSIVRSTSYNIKIGLLSISKFLWISCGAIHN